MSFASSIVDVGVKIEHTMKHTLAALRPCQQDGIVLKVKYQAMTTDLKKGLDRVTSV